MTDHRTVQLVICFLGGIAALLAGGEIVLVREIIHQGAGKGTVDPAAAAMVASIGTLAGGALGALGAVLVSTRTTGSGADEPVPVAVVNEADEPLPTAEVEPEPAAAGRRR